MSEHDEQVALFYWAKLNEERIPELWLLHAIPNGAKLPWRRNQRGERYSPEGGRLKAEGLKAGVPDICLPVAKRGFHGLYIEMKFGQNTMTEEQKLWRDRLWKEGYLVVEIRDWERAAAVIEEYLEGGSNV